jgi:hypothetical protein
MTLDTTGRLLEGIRTSTGNNSFTFPPRNFISNEATFQSENSRAEYVIFVGSLDPDKIEFDIADPDLIFYYTKNESTVSRFDYDSYGRRFAPLPGGAPVEIGTIENSPRLVIPIPDLTLTSAPFDIYIGSTARVVTFTLTSVPTEGDFTDPNLMTINAVEISEEDGKLNFSSLAISNYEEQTVLATRQSFLDRTQATGSFGSLPQSSAVDYYLFLNPRPATGQTPLIRIDYQRHLTAIEVATESLLGSPLSGTCHWSADTGRVRFSTDDVADNLEREVYYDGVVLGSKQLTTVTVGPVTAAFPLAAFTITGAIGIDDPVRFIISAESGGVRHFFPIALVDSTNLPSKEPASGTAYVDTVAGFVYLSSNDIDPYNGWGYSHTDTQVEIESGVSVQFFRSGVNGSGLSPVPDFKLIYEVEDQIIQSRIGLSPLVVLPTVPVVDDSLIYRVSQGFGSSGTFTGELVDGTDENKFGFGYLLDLDTKSFSFSDRKTTSRTLLKPASTIKLDDGAISEFGFEVIRDGTSLIPGVDFNFNESVGLIDFVQPVGENDADNILGIIGTTSGDIFTANSSVFTSSHVNRYLYVATDNNIGIYTIIGFTSATQVTVTPSFPTSGPTTADLRQEIEIVADRFWVEFLPPYKKFSLSKADNQSGIFTTITNDQFNVFTTTGQVNLDNPAKPGEVYQIAYISLDSEDEGVTTTPTNRVEKALFKIRQETGTVIPSGGSSSGGFRPIIIGSSGSKVVTFNPENNTVNEARPIDVYIDGVPLEEDEFYFEAPGTIRLVTPIGDEQLVKLNYWIEEATGNNSNFDLLYSPIDLDTPEVVAEEDTAIFNGDQRSVLSPGSAMLINEREVVIVQSVAYDSSADATTVTFETTPTISSGGAPLQVTGPITGSYRETETNAVDIISEGSDQIVIMGNRISDYPEGTIVTVDGDAYLVRTSSYDSSSGQTAVSVAASAKKNYIIPTVTRTIRPILFPTSSFQTKLEVNLNYPFTLVKTGSESATLIDGVDYTVSENTVSLTADIEFGDALYAMYVGRDIQPFGTSFQFNYAYAIAPNDSNGIPGQQLLSSYNLYGPDSFFYRAETVETFLPEVSESLASGSQTSSGPNTADVVTSIATKDAGSPGLYFDEKHEGNLDIAIARLLKFYNDLINYYEDILSNLDGRAVGGNQGRFRFDGNFDNPPRTTFSEITNDIDDQVKLYDARALTGFFTFETIPVYGKVGTPNNLSRLFPTVLVATAAINDETGFFDFGNVLGSLGVSNIRSTGPMISSRGRTLVNSVTSNGFSFNFDSNGDPDNLIPEFKPNQKVTVYSLDGVPDITGRVLAEIATSITLDTATTLKACTLLRDVSDDPNVDTTLSYYVPGTDLKIDFENGQITNFTLPPPFNIGQNSINGNEILDTEVFINNTDIEPRRIPALDGEERNDDGTVPAPILKRVGELLLLEREQNAFSLFGSAQVNSNKTTITGSTITPSVGDTVRFIDGPNTGQERNVVTVINPSSFIVSPAFPSADSTGSNLVVITAFGGLDDILNQELNVLENNVASDPIAPSQLGTLDSELQSIENVILTFGEQISSGTGTTTTTTLTDASATFTADGVNNQSLLYASSGDNRGLYKVASATATEITIDDASPFAEFPVATSTPYIIIKRWGMLSGSGPEFITEFFRETLDFLNKTQAFASNLDPADVASRQGDINVRINSINDFIFQLEGILTTVEQLYDIRYLWIDQRVNRREGTLSATDRAVATRQEDTQKVINDQQKLLVVNNLRISL